LFTGGTVIKRAWNMRMPQIQLQVRGLSHAFFMLDPVMPTA